MKTNVLKCGHSPNAIRTFSDGTQKPACVICGCTEFKEDIPDLTNRKARCHCGKEVPSSFNLPFFQYQGDQSSADQSLVQKRNSLLKESWSGKSEKTKEKLRQELQELDSEIKKTATKDTYYCGCDGWN